jgi:hypothetical protein
MHDAAWLTLHGELHLLEEILTRPPADHRSLTTH